MAGRIWTGMALGALLAGALATPAVAKEGMWPPNQLPDIADDLAETGLALDPDRLSNLTGDPMGAVISLGNCTASFVSAQGLAVTNHHCARGSIQYNSTSGTNYLETGFLAARKADELPAAPGSRIYVTVDLRDVTAFVRSGFTPDMDGRTVQSEIEARKKTLVAECEAQAGHRCEVVAFNGGLSYRLIDRLEIRDVRLVYAPADSIGKYGGDVDNWMWPRHTGDFAFYRAYVGPDGQPADYSPDNVPFQPPHHLKVSGEGLSEGDFVMAAGYPGTTNRYARKVEVEHVFDWYYPTFMDLMVDWIATIEAAAPAGSETRIKYASRLAGLNNYAKNLGGQLRGAQAAGLIDRRAEREAALSRWLASRPNGANAQAQIADLDRLIEQTNAAERRRFWYDQVRRPQLLDAARILYRLAQERQKPDESREPGYQERDEPFIRQRLEALSRRFDPEVDRQEWLLFLERYMAQPDAVRVADYDAALGLGPDVDRETLSSRLAAFYEATRLDEADTRLGLMDATPAEIEASNDPFLRLAVAISEADRRFEDVEEALAGRMALLRPAYMQAIIDWQSRDGLPAYPDANGTLRVTYGTVMGGPADRDGLRYAPFTTLEGILEKNTGEDPFDAPERQLERIRAGAYGPFADPALGSVPVNFLTDLDSTGGNSGSPTLNADGELVGLLFDGTLESVNADWLFDPETTRTIHVDSRYMLWTMAQVDGALALIDEMTVVDADGAPMALARQDQ